MELNILECHCWYLLWLNIYNRSIIVRWKTLKSALKRLNATAKSSFIRLIQHKYDKSR
jgi:hypothetical protein